LNIENNNINYLPDSIDNLKSLDKIHLDLDKIQHLSDFVVNLLFESKEIEKKKNTMNLLSYSCKYNHISIIKRLYNEKYIKLIELFNQYQNADKSQLNSLLKKMIIPYKLFSNFLNSLTFTKKFLKSFIKAFNDLEFYQKSSITAKNLENIFDKIKILKYDDSVKTFISYIISRSKDFIDLDLFRNIFALILKEEDKELLIKLINSKPEILSSIPYFKFLHLLRLKIESFNEEAKKNIDLLKQNLLANIENMPKEEQYQSISNLININESQDILNLSSQDLVKIFIKAYYNELYDKAKSLLKHISPKKIDINELEKLFIILLIKKEKTEIKNFISEDLIKKLSDLSFLNLLDLKLEYEEKTQTEVEKRKKILASALNEVISPKNFKIFSNITGCKIKLIDSELGMQYYQIESKNSKSYYNIFFEHSSFTIFHLLCKYGCTKPVELILKNIAVHIESKFEDNNKVFTPYLCAKANGHKKIVELLDQAKKQIEQDKEKFKQEKKTIDDSSDNDQ